MQILQTNTLIADHLKTWIYSNDRGEPAISYRWNKRLSLRINRMKFKTAGKLPITIEEFIEYTPIQ